MLTNEELKLELDSTFSQSWIEFWNLIFYFLFTIEKEWITGVNIETSVKHYMANIDTFG